MVNLSSYPKPVIDRAFYLQQKIKRDGLDSVGFMHDAFLVIQAQAVKTTEKEIANNLKKQGF